MAVDATAKMTMIADTAADRGPGYRAFHLAMILAVIAAALAIAAGLAVAVRQRLKPDERVGSVRMVADGSVVPNASSFLTRDSGGIDITLQTSGLPKGHVIILKALIFNEPKNCRHGANGARCGEEDINDSAVDGSVVFVAGSQTRVDDTLKFATRLTAGDAKRASSGGGLTNPFGAYVHLVLVDHGPPAAGLYNDQLSTLAGGCTNPPPNSGRPGPNECPDLQYSVQESVGLLEAIAQRSWLTPTDRQ